MTLASRFSKLPVGVKALVSDLLSKRPDDIMPPLASDSLPDDIMPPLASDLFSKLPDELLCYIISYLPIKEAVRSSVLSTRWRYLYHKVSQLTLSPNLLMGPVLPNPVAIAKAENIISNILELHSSDLKTFVLYTPSHDWRFTSRNLCKWVQCVASKNVEELSISHFSTFGHIQLRENFPPSIFLCNKLRSLTLYDYIVSEIPTGFGGFNHLIDCLFRNVEFRDDTLALFVSHCPLLEALKLDHCRVVTQNITISAPHLEVLTLGPPNRVEILTVNCPKLRHLDLCRINNLTVNGLLFQELSVTVKHLHMDRDGTVLMMSLDPSRDGTNRLSEERCAEITGTFKFLQKLIIGNQLHDKMDIPTTNLLQGLPHLECLDIYGAICLRLTKDPNPTMLESPLLNIQSVNARLHNYDEKEIDLLVWLLGNSPALEFMEVSIPPPPRETGKYIQLLRRILNSNFSRPWPPARVRVS